MGSQHGQLDGMGRVEATDRIWAPAPERTPAEVLQAWELWALKTESSLPFSTRVPCDPEQELRLLPSHTHLSAASFHFVTPGHTSGDSPPAWLTDLIV